MVYKYKIADRVKLNKKLDDRHSAGAAGAVIKRQKRSAAGGKPYNVYRVEFDRNADGSKRSPTTKRTTMEKNLDRA